MGKNIRQKLSSLDSQQAFTIFKEKNNNVRSVSPASSQGMNIMMESLKNPKNYLVGNKIKTDSNTHEKETINVDIYGRKNMKFSNEFKFLQKMTDQQFV